MRTVNETVDKVSRYRMRMHAAGLRPLQLWIWDTRSPEFAAEVQRQCLALKNDPAEVDMMHFSEAAARQIEGWE